MKSITIPLLAATATALSTPMADPSGARSINPGTDFKGGAGVGRLVLDGADTPTDAWSCKYDMVLVERLQDRPDETEDGLFVPRENLPKMHLCKVISMGPGREEENGMVAPMPNIEPGDVVIAKNPWGIGPKDEETAAELHAEPGHCCGRGREVVGVNGVEWEYRGEGCCTE